MNGGLAYAEGSRSLSSVFCLPVFWFWKKSCAGKEAGTFAGAQKSAAPALWRDPLCKNAASGCIPQDRWKAKRTSAVFFQSVAKELEGEGRKLPEIVFQDQLGCLGESAWNREDRAFLLELGKQLGCPDLSVQLQTLELFEEGLRELIKKASEDCREKAKIYRYLGALSGLFLVVLLL